MPEKQPTQSRGESMQDVQESREWLRVTLSSIGDGVITTDAHGNCTFLNPVAEALTGWSQKQAAGVGLETVFRIVNEDTRATVENPALRALRDGLVVGLANHTLLIAKDGVERPIDDSAAPIRKASGEVAGTVLVFRDITERKQQEKSIAAALAFSQAVIATLHHPFLVLTADLRVHLANAAFYRTFETDRKQTLGHLVYELGDGGWNIPRLRELLEEILPNDGEFEELEFEHQFPTIGRRIVVLNARRLHDGIPERDLILLGIEDQTARRDAEQMVRESETRYRRLFQSAKDGILIVDATTGKITDANPYIAGLLGADPSNLIGKQLWEIGLFGDIEHNKLAFQRLQRDGYVQYDDLPLRNALGETVEVEFVSNLYHEDHHLVAQCNVRSISERRLRDQARTLADENRRKDEFIAMLSHELRNPLAPIRTAAYLLSLEERAGNENAVQRQAREVIERQVSHLSHLVNDLLEVSRVVSGGIRVQFQLLDLREVVLHAVEMVRPLIEQRRHQFSISLPEEAAWIHADPTRMEEIVTNLLINAAKYTENDGAGRIRVKLEVDANAGELVLRIIDNGVGIEPELLQNGRIFDLFTQGKRTLDRAQGGLGIGLTLVHRLVELQRGTVRARSEGPGKGSEFIVRLPLATPGEPTPATAQTSAAGDRVHGADASNGIPAEPDRRRVLVVDDNLDQTDMLAASLRKQGFSVQTARTGPEALRVAMQWRPDVVLLDIGLPEIDGYEVARRIRAEPAMRGVQLIAITGYGRPEDIDKSTKAGFVAHLTKPFDIRELDRLMGSSDRSQH